MARRNAPEAGAQGGRKLLYSIHEGKQEAFLSSEAEERLYGGAAGGGKSYALRAALVSYCLTYPGATAVLFRRTYRELEDTHIMRLQAELPSYVAEFRSTAHEFYFPETGSTLMLRFAEKEQDVYSYDTFEADIMAFDELTAFSEFQYVYLTTRCRSVKPWWPGPRILSATNPGNVGHAWVKSRFIDFCKPMIVTRAPDEQGGFMRQFIPARLIDNPTLMKSDPGYINRLKALPWEDYQAKALGNWDIFAGQFFKRWRSPVHIVPQFTPPADWRRFISVDYGYGAPHAVLWGAQPPGTHTVILYREQYGAGVSAREQARRAREATEASTEKIEVIVLDPSMFAKEKDKDGELMASLADVWKEEFLGLCDVVKGNNERIQGASLFRECLDWAGTEDSSGINVIVPPRLRVMEDRCPNFIRTVPNLVHSKNNVEDVDTDGEDHTYDCARYLLRYLFQAPTKLAHKEYVYSSAGLVEVMRAPIPDF